MAASFFFLQKRALLPIFKRLIADDWLQQLS